jgi:hypothetical protein
VNHHAKQIELPTGLNPGVKTIAGQDKPDRQVAGAELEHRSGRQAAAPADRVTGELMTLRPFKTIRQYKQLVALLNQQIELLKQQIAQEAELKKLQAGQVTFLTECLARQNAKLSQSQVPVPMPLPTVEAVEGLVGAFFDAESVIIAREALELTRNLAPVGPQDVKATNLCLMKLWRHYAMRKVEQAAKQDML